jgi:hypothetical protein
MADQTLQDKTLTQDPVGGEMYMTRGGSDFRIATEKLAELNSIEHILEVATSGAEYSSVTDAIAAITGNSSTNRFVIKVAPGVYTIDNSLGPVQLKAFTHIQAEGNRMVVFTPQDPTQDMFLGENFAYMTGILFTGNTGSAFALKHSAAGSTIIRNCVLRDTSNGFQVSGASSTLEVNELAVNNPATTTTTVAIEATGGSLGVDGCFARPTSNVTTLINITGASTQGTVHNITMTSPNIGNGIRVGGGALLVGTSNNIGYCTDGIVIDGTDTEVRLDANKILYCQNNGFRIDNVGTAPKVFLFATTVSECTGLNFNVLNPTAIVAGNGFTELNNSYRQAESCLGSGDSYTAGMMVYTYNPTGAVWNDVSSEAASASGSSFAFSNTITDSAIYFASSISYVGDVIKHFGIKTKLDIAAVLGGGDMIFEYWNGVTWTEVNAMEVESGGSYWPHANAYMQHIGSYHIRYDNTLAVDSWTKNDPMSLGTDYYWIRLRITSTITTSPNIEQIKLHSNRFEVNGDGWIEYFGTARPIGQLGLRLADGEPFEGNMQSSTLYINENLGVGHTSNMVYLVSYLMIVIRLVQ